MLADIGGRVEKACDNIKLQQDISRVAFGLTIDKMGKQEAASELLTILNDLSEEIY